MISARLGGASRWRLILLYGAATALVLVLALVGLRITHTDVLPGLTLEGRPLGGLDRQGLEAAVEEHAQTRAEDLFAVEAVAPRGVTRRLEYPLEELGFAVDRRATVERVWNRGRQLNPLGALVDHLRSLGGGIDVEPSIEVDPDEYDAWVATAADELDTEPVEARLVITGTEVTFVDPEPGLAVHRDALEAQVLEALESGLGGVEIPATREPPEYDPAELRALVGEAERAVSGPVRLTRGEAALELPAAQIGDLLTAEQTKEGARLAIDPEALDAAVGVTARETFDRDPVSARVRLTGGSVVIDPSTKGFQFDAAAAAEQIVDVATAEPNDGEPPRTAELQGEVTEASLTTAEAEALQVTERVSSFTTEYPAGQSRVQNIHRMAELVNGVLLLPGETFSINEHVGPRTREKGFTDGGVIVGGEFQTDVGGGVSQFATTFFNAAFFGGYELLEHQPHSYYISRYPEGRESTLNYPNIDVRIRNDSPYGLLIATGYTATSVTVEMWGKKWVDVDARTSGRRNIHEPHITERENPRLSPGATRVVQSGRPGFTVSYTRILQYHDGRTDEQTWTHTYRSEPRIIERGPTRASAPEPAPAPAPAVP